MWTSVSKRTQAVLAALVVLVASCWLYVGAGELGLLRIDDPDYLELNPWIRGLTAANLQQVFTEPYFANYSPLHLVSYMLDYEINGLDPVVLHRSSVVWGALVAVAVYLLALQLTKRISLALLAGLVFAAHPAHVEAIAWLSSRKDLVAGFFGVLSACAYLRYRERAGAKAWYVAALVLFGLGLAGKMSVVVLPGVYALHDVWVERRRWTATILDKVPFALMALGFHLAVASAQPATGQEFTLVKFGRALAESVWLVTGFGTYTLYRDWSLPEADSLAGIAYSLAPFACALALVWAAWKLPRTWSRVPLVLMAWIVVALIPPQILSFVSPVTDRYLYLPTVGLAVLVAWGAGVLTTLRVPWGRWLAVTASIVCLAHYAHATRSCLAEWGDPRSVWYAAALRSREPEAHSNLAIHYQDLSDQLALRAPSAIAPALSLVPYVRSDATSQTALRQALEAKQYDQAEVQTYIRELRALALGPLDTALANLGTRIDPNLYFRKAKLLFDQSAYSDAKIWFQKALAESERVTYSERKQEMLVRTHHALAVLAWREADWDATVRAFETVVQLQQAAQRTWVDDAAGWLVKARARRAEASKR